MDRTTSTGLKNSTRLLLRAASLVIATVAAAAPIARADGTAASTRAPEVPKTVTGKDGVKTYLVTVAEGCEKAAQELKSAADEYANLVAENGSPAAAASAKPQAVADLVNRLRDAYQRMDSYGYEYVEGIVAGVPSLIKYDVELDSGVPAAGAAMTDNVAAVRIDGGDVKLERDGSLNNYLVEPTVFGTNARFVDGSATLPGFEKAVNLPKPKLIVAMANYAVDAYGRLLADSKAWQPSDKDCFLALSNMTPTLADYFDEWKDVKKSGAASGGRFIAVSRVSDMRGIMSSTRLAWLGIEPLVRTKDAALADKLTQGYDGILKFIDKVDDREKIRPLKTETIDALGSQAKESTDKMAVQIAQAAALFQVNVNDK